jgi:diguanylate cyclase (GGDEF)-like protein
MTKRSNMYQKTRNTKHIIFIICMIVVLLVVYAASMLDRNQKSLELAYSYAYNILQDNTQEQKNIFILGIKEKYKILHVISRYVELRQSEISDEMIAEALSILAKNNFDTLFIAGKDGMAYTYDGVKIDVSSYDFFKKAMQGKDAIERRSGILDGKKKFIFASPLFSKGKVVGAIIGCSEQHAFEAMLISQAYHAKAYSFVCDSNGTIIINSNHRSAIEQEYNIFDAITSSYSPDDKELLALRRNIEEGYSGSIAYTLHGAQRYAAYTALGINNWFIFNVVPESVIDYDAQKITSIEIFFIAITIFITLCIILSIVIFERRNGATLRKHYEDMVTREEFFRIAMQNSTMGMWEYDIKKHCITQNDYSIKFHGLDKIIPDVPESLVHSGFVHPDSVNDFYALYARLQAGEENVEGTFCVQNAEKNGWCFERIQYTTLFNQEGEPYRAIGVGYDVSEKQELEQSYKTELHYLQALTDDVMGMAIFDLESEKQQKIEMRNEEENILFSTNSLRSFFASEANFISSDISIKNLFQLISYDTIQDFLRKEENREFEYIRDFLDGTKKWILFTMHLRISPHNGHRMLFVYSRDIDDQKRKEVELLKAATTDSLTSLYNHEATLQRIDSVLQDAKQRGMHALFIIDLDRFKNINDTLGHQGGDRALCTMAAMLQKNFRADDVLGRIGGDEFIAFMKNVPTADIIELKAAELVKSLHILLCEDNEKQCMLSASIGVAIAQEGDTVQTLYKKADAALYDAKAQGRNGYALYKTEPK